MKNKFYIWLPSLFLALIMNSCKEIEEYSEIPEIKYKSFILSDHLYTDTSVLGFQYVRGILTFEFTDGDGDFGHYYVPNDTTYNLFFSQYEKKEGIFIHLELVDSLINRRIMYEESMAREGQNKLLKGDIEVFFRFFKNFTPYDTIKYDFYITDRAGHKSNVESTEEIIFDWEKYTR